MHVRTLLLWSKAAEALSTRPAKGVTFAGLVLLTLVAAAQDAMALDQRCAAATPERLAACIDDCRDRPEDELRDCQRLCKEGHEAAKTACPTEPGRMAPTDPAKKRKWPRLPG